MRYIKLLIIVGIAFSLSSCFEEDPYYDAESTFGIRHDRSLTDYENKAASTSGDIPNFSAVVAFNYSLDGSDNFEYVASGALISDEWILTAGHNFYAADEQNNPAPVSGIEVLVGNDPNNPDGIYGVDEIVYHPTWLAGDQEFKYGNDFCLVRLSQPVNSVTPVELNSSKSESIGSTVWYCGFGDYSSTAGQNQDLYSKKHAYENLLDRVLSVDGTSTGGQNYSGGLLAYDFDDPEGIVNSLGDSTVYEDEAILGSGTSNSGAVDLEAATVAGDSGGPLFIKIGGDWKLAGVLHGGAYEPIRNHKDSDYGDISIFMRVSSAIDWINSVVD